MSEKIDKQINFPIKVNGELYFKLRVYMREIVIRFPNVRYTNVSHLFIHICFCFFLSNYFQTIFIPISNFVMSNIIKI